MELKYISSESVCSSMSNQIIYFSISWYKFGSVRPIPKNFVGECLILGGIFCSLPNIALLPVSVATLPHYNTSFICRFMLEITLLMPRLLSWSLSIHFNALDNFPPGLIHTFSLFLTELLLTWCLTHLVSATVPWFTLSCIYQRSILWSTQNCLF